jgi:LCP family protein required for cell wall assembly
MPSLSFSIGLESLLQTFSAGWFMANSVERFPTGSSVSNTFHPDQQTPPSETGKRQRVSKPPQTSKSMSPFVKGLCWGAIVSLTATVSAAIGATVALVNPFAVHFSSILGHSQSNFPNLSPLSPYRLSRPLNLLVMGIDSVPGARNNGAASFGGSTDTLLLSRFDPTDNSLRMLSIPRDSQVEIPGLGYSKINQANVQGGPALASRVVSKTLNNVPIDRYVRFTLEAFRELVDLVGGVEVFVPEKMSYQDLTQNLEINLEPGWQTLNGEQAEQFIRFRSEPSGDPGRIQRQQILLKALQQRLYTPAMVSKLPQIVRILQQYIDTNLSLDEMFALANFGQGLEREQIKMVLLPGSLSQPGDSNSDWIISRSARDRLMQDYFAVSSDYQPIRRSPNQVRIAIQNATDEPGITNRIVEYLAQQNFHNIYIIPNPSPILQQTEIVAQQGDLESADVLKKVLGIGRVEADSTGELDSDLTIRIGMDGKQFLVSKTLVKLSQKP